ncbi:MAG: hypothetical protein KJO38_04390, partial [Gammaproteobacteria bacterium]|nr:hypothetical protein [Gammaproteobacteria bacterium]
MDTLLPAVLSGSGYRGRWLIATSAWLLTATFAVPDPDDLLPVKIHNPTMPVIQSLRRLLMLHDLAFLLLVLVTGALAGVWVLFWQDTSQESIRLNSLAHTAEQIRSDLYRQIKEVIVARLNEDADALQSYAAFTRGIDEQFNNLRRRSRARDEDYAVQELQQAYRLLQRDMNNVVEDPYLLNRMTRIRFLDPRYEAELVGKFETAHKNFIGLIDQKLVTLDARVARWSQLTRYLLLLP